MKEGNNNIRLTQFCEGAGCGCKISPKVLTEILETKQIFTPDPALLVGNEQRDDAAVYDMGNGTAIISTTDFFTPIVDDPYTFGRIAATNAISDIYAMGGKPLLAIAILGWPVKTLPAAVAQKVIEGGRDVCEKAGITLAGGHSIENLEPIFGLAVTGIVDIDKLKKNDTAEAGCKLLMTKPLGVGILATAQKHGTLTPEDAETAVRIMTGLNRVGEQLAGITGVKAMTDVTGFGLLGHLVEMCEGAGLSAEIEYQKVPKIQAIDKYLKLKDIPGGTVRNWDSYGNKISLSDRTRRFILCDPQTSGGLLLAVSPESVDQVKETLKEHNILADVFGEITEKKEWVVKVV